METLLATGRVRNIGVPNFPPDQLKRLIKFSSIKPAVHQMDARIEPLHEPLPSIHPILLPRFLHFPFCRSRSGFVTTVLLFQLLTLVYFTTQLVTPTTCLSCLYLPHVYIEALEPHLINRVLMLYLLIGARTTD